MIYLAMIFMHVLDDYGLQARCLSSLKQKNWWKEHKDYLPSYRYDYIVALLMHSFSWTFMIMLPIALRMGFDLTIPFGIAFALNLAIHAAVDDLKANRKKINLVVDQTIHIVQILATGFALTEIFV